YTNTKDVLKLASRYRVVMPITEQLYQILYHNKNVYDAALTLLGRYYKDKQISYL
ncbi:MAG: glycerol-3-phosphate dehydrogenase, partial [Candidatus Baumannia cicadellinicola]|nr:glycerol-3-phosphate dehydrogenase [Candidatus Baumannia cicadellinicola]